jgi:ATP-binding cassette subfamily C (CFTR/MRP) protein 4
MTILGALVVPSIVNPYVLIPLVPLLIVFYLVQRYFVRTGRQLKRLDNTGRSPIFIHTNSTIEGLSIIRVCKSSDLLVREFHLHCDNHTRAFFGFHVCHRWFGLRLDLLCSAYTIVTLFACIGLRGKKASIYVALLVFIHFKNCY